MKIKKYLLTESEYTRRREKMSRVENIVITSSRYAGFSALKNRNAIERLKNQKEKYFSCHYIIDNKGIVLNIIPETETAICTKNDKIDSKSISILLTLDKNNEYSSKELLALNSLITKLKSKYNLEEENILKEYDVNGSRRPVIFIEEPILLHELQKK